MHPLQFFGPLSILLVPVKDRLFLRIPDAMWLFLRFHCDSSLSLLQRCLEAVEGWAGSVSVKHSYISPVKSNVIIESRVTPGIPGLSPQNHFLQEQGGSRAGKEAWGWAVLHP